MAAPSRTVLDDKAPRQERIRRKGNGFDLDITVNRENFADIENPSVRHWILHRTADEFAADLNHLDSIAKRFVRGSGRPEISTDWRVAASSLSESELTIAGQQVMQRWEAPLMKVMAEIATETHGDVLEVGFGMGISASFIQSMGVKSHTIIEYNEDVLKKGLEWRRSFPECDIRFVPGRWQDAEAQPGRYDAIFFDTYPTEEAEFLETAVQSVTPAECFFPTAARLLRAGGIFTYYTNEIDSFSRRHQRAVFNHFRCLSLQVVGDLHPPQDCNYWWSDSMVAVKAIK
ncbi:MAG TPA: class I SAM-dependent methyltransferase [Candidatus Angelobacter sp.]|jgi:predicted O-methyltransferase YrrM